MKIWSDCPDPWPYSSAWRGRRLMGWADMFGNVKIAGTPLTERLGYANQNGVCFGFTTPSVTGVEVIGEHDDVARTSTSTVSRTPGSPPISSSSSAMEP